MHHSTLVRALQPLANFNPVFQNLLGRQRSLAQAIGQRLAFQTFHHQEVHAILMPHIVQRANVGMVQRRDGARLAIEALLGFRIFRQMAGQNFNRDNTVEARIFRAVHLSHAARAQRRLNFVRTKLRARGQSHVRAIIA